MHSPPPLLRCIPPHCYRAAIDLVRFYSALFCLCGTDLLRRERAGWTRVQDEEAVRRTAVPVPPAYRLHDEHHAHRASGVSHSLSSPLLSPLSLSPLLSPSLFSRVPFYSYLPCRIDWLASTIQRLHRARSERADGNELLDDVARQREFL